jgi:hypothetical protein
MLANRTLNPQFCDILTYGCATEAMSDDDYMDNTDDALDADARAMTSDDPYSAIDLHLTYALVQFQEVGVGGLVGNLGCGVQSSSSSYCQATTLPSPTPTRLEACIMIPDRSDSLVIGNQTTTRACCNVCVRWGVSTPRVVTLAARSVCGCVCVCDHR